MSGLIDLLLQGAVGSFLPTLLGAFLGFLLGTAQTRSADKRIFYSLVNFAFVDLNDRISTVNGYIHLIEQGEEPRDKTRPQEFAKLNLPSFPDSLSVLLGGTSTRYAKTAIWATLMNRISVARTMHNQIPIHDYPTYDNLSRSYTDLLEMYSQVSWFLYCLARNCELPFKNEHYQQLVFIINAIKPQVLQLEKIKLSLPSTARKQGGCR